MQPSELFRKAMERFHRDIPTRIPSTLPLLDRYRRHFSSPRAFVGLDVLFIQHHLAPWVPRVRAMLEDGLDADRCWFVDIPYSTHMRVRKELLLLGCRQEQMAIPHQDPLAPYTQAQLRRVEDIVLELARRRPNKLLVVDDGAYFLRVLERRKDIAARFRGRTHIVEQTTRGLRFIKELRSLQFPVVSIAKTHTKVKLESPFIGAAVSRAVVRSVRARGKLKERLRRVAIVGFGAVGEATTREITKLRHRLGLQHEEPIHVVEINEKLAARITELGARPLSRLSPQGNYDLIVGCTGYASFHVGQTSLLAHDALLASASSASVEFNRKDFLERADRPGSKLTIINRDEIRRDLIHAPITMNDGKRSFSFLNAGFPVNFDGRLECLPAWAIQPTHVLLYGACRQVLRTKRPGLKSLSRNEDEWTYHQGLAEIGRVLLT